MDASVHPHPKPLDGIRVVELGARIAVPFAARLLAEFGADVVKVEPPVGDPARAEAPVGFAAWNRTKRSVVLELDDDEGAIATLHDLLAGADVLVHDLAAAHATRLGLDDGAVTARHPHLILASSPAYPRGHTREDAAAVDSLVQAAEGFMDEQQGHRDGPVYIRLPFPSWCAAYLLTAGILARLAQRERSGVVAAVHTSLLQGGLAPAALYWSRWQRVPPLPPGQPAPLGNGREHTLPKLWPDAALSIFQCADGEWIQLAGALGGWLESPPMLEALALADAVELSEVGVTPANRARFDAVFHTRDSAEWTRRFRDSDVPCVVVQRLGECFTSEQAAANGYAVTVDDAQLGPLLAPGAPLDTVPPSASYRPAPRLGDTAAAEVTADWGRRPAPPRRTGEAPLPLAGLRALDFGAAVSGPFGAQCLADLGADVVKVEPITGDRGRSLTQFAGCHRGKRAVAIDLKSDAGRAVLARLVASSDLVLHNMRLPAARRLGLDGDGLRAQNPAVVFSHISAYGTSGRWAADPGYDPTAQAVTGWEHADAGDGMAPVWLRNSAFDVQTGIAACAGAMLGLVARERTGTPGEARTSLLAVGMASASEVAVDAAGQVTPAAQLDAEQTGVSPYQRIHRLVDGWLAVAALTGAQRDALDGALGDPASRAQRLATEPLVATLDVLHTAGVPAVAVAEDQRDTFFDSAAHRRLGLSRHLHTTGYGEIDIVGGFWTLAGARDPDRESVPAFGEQTAQILTELGFTTGEIDAMHHDRVVTSGSRDRAAEAA